MPLQAVNVWDARQRTPAMHLPEWHTNAINTIKCARQRRGSEPIVTLHSRYHPTQPDLVMTCGFDQTVKVTRQNTRAVPNPSFPLIPAAPHVTRPTAVDGLAAYAHQRGRAR